MKKIDKIDENIYTFIYGIEEINHTNLPLQSHLMRLLLTSKPSNKQEYFFKSEIAIKKVWGFASFNFNSETLRSIFKKYN